MALLSDLLMVSVLILNSNCPFWRYVGLCLKSYPRVIFLALRRLLLLSRFVLAFLPYLPPRWNNLVSLPKTHPHLGFSFGPWLPPALGSHSCLLLPPGHFRLVCIQVPREEMRSKDFYSFMRLLPIWVHVWGLIMCQAQWWDLFMSYLIEPPW